jgi:hypothetical protein
MPICRRGGPVSILSNSILEICGGQSGTGTSFYSEYFGFLASLSLSILIFIYMSLLPGRQTGEAWEPSKQHCSFGHQGAKDRQVVSFFIYFSLRRVKELFSVLIVRNLCGVHVGLKVSDNLNRLL